MLSRVLPALLPLTLPTHLSSSTFSFPLSLSHTHIFAELMGFLTSAGYILASLSVIIFTFPFLPSFSSSLLIWWRKPTLVDQKCLACFPIPGFPKLIILSSTLPLPYHIAFFFPCLSTLIIASLTLLHLLLLLTFLSYYLSFPSSCSPSYPDYLLTLLFIFLSSSFPPARPSLLPLSPSI